MQINFEGRTIVVERGDGPRIGRESTFWYHVKRELRRMGFDAICKLMWKDGHMVSDTQHYVRDKKWGWALWQGDYAIRNPQTEYNRGEKVWLLYEDWKGERNENPL